mmetsp:Transcript_119999/g.384288  ORF Transcript_119999/g.384288 Transcript_119999/m.384288 type:complete len:386 (-) Transcript_119999:19-1176(-)
MKAQDNKSKQEAIQSTLDSPAMQKAFKTAESGLKKIFEFFAGWKGTADAMKVAGFLKFGECFGIVNKDALTLIFRQGATGQDLKFDSFPRLMFLCVVRLADMERGDQPSSEDDAQVWTKGFRALCKHMLLADLKAMKKALDTYRRDSETLPTFSLGLGGGAAPAGGVGKGGEAKTGGPKEDKPPAGEGGELAGASATSLEARGILAEAASEDLAGGDATAPVEGILAEAASKDLAGGDAPAPVEGDAAAASGASPQTSPKASPRAGAGGEGTVDGEGEVAAGEEKKAEEPGAGPEGDATGEAPAAEVAPAVAAEAEGQALAAAEGAAEGAAEEGVDATAAADGAEAAPAETSDEAGVAAVEVQEESAKAPEAQAQEAVAAAVAAE